MQKGNVIFLIVFLLLIHVSIISYRNVDEKKLSYCDKDEDCVVYTIASISGEEYACINPNEEAKFSALTKQIMMFKYRKKYGQATKPDSCICEENFCKITD